MIAGSVGISVTSSGEKLAVEDLKIGNDTFAPASGWWMFTKKSEEELAKAEAVWGIEAPGQTEESMTLN